MTNKVDYDVRGECSEADGIGPPKRPISVCVMSLAPSVDPRCWL